MRSAPRGVMRSRVGLGGVVLVAWVSTALAQPPRGDAPLAEARRLAAAGQHEASLAAFEHLVVERPSEGGLRCEAGFVALEAGHLDRADVLVREGLQRIDPQHATAAEHRTLGACRYNLGRIAEARGDLVLARTFYRDAGDHATTRIAMLDARLRGLPSAGALEAATCLQIACGLDTETSDADSFAGDLVVGVGPDEDDDAAEDAGAVAAGIDEIDVVDYGADQHGNHPILLYAHDPSGWSLVGRALDADSPGLTQFEDVTSARLAPLRPGTPPIARIDAEASFHVTYSGDDDELETDDESWRITILCGTALGATHCASFRLSGDRCRTTLRIDAQGSVVMRRTGAGSQCAPSRAAPIATLLADPAVALPSLSSP